MWGSVESSHILPRPVEAVKSGGGKGLRLTLNPPPTTEIRVRLAEFHNRTYVDVRNFVVADATGDRVPTRKGIAIAPKFLLDVIAALQEAERQAVAAGLINGSEEPSTV